MADQSLSKVEENRQYLKTIELDEFLVKFVTQVLKQKPGQEELKGFARSYFSEVLEHVIIFFFCVQYVCGAMLTLSFFATGQIFQNCLA